MRIMQIALFRAKFKLRTTTNLFASPHVASSALSLSLSSLSPAVQTHRHHHHHHHCHSHSHLHLASPFPLPPRSPYSICRCVHYGLHQWNEMNAVFRRLSPLSPCSLFGVFPLADFRHLHQKFKNSINYSVEFSAFLYFSPLPFSFLLFLSFFFFAFFDLLLILRNSKFLNGPRCNCTNPTPPCSM